MMIVDFGLILVSHVMFLVMFFLKLSGHLLCSAVSPFWFSMGFVLLRFIY